MPASQTQAKAKLVRHDLILKERKYIEEVINAYYNKLDKKLTQHKQWQAFAKETKTTLDKTLGPHWHVLLGTSLGFACKKRQQAMGVWKMDERCVVVVWKSPGIEEPAAADEPDAAAEAAEVPAMRVVQPTKVEAGSELERIFASVRELLPQLAGKDVQETAQMIRRRLTSDFSTIWHVVAGTEFALEPAEDVRNVFIVSVGKMRVMGFQHEQFTGGFKLDVPKLLTGLPYLLVVLLSFLYMFLSSLCKEGAAEPRWLVSSLVKRKMCHEDWESDLGIMGAVILGSSFVFRKIKSLTSRASQKKQS